MSKVNSRTPESKTHRGLDAKLKNAGLNDADINRPLVQRALRIAKEKKSVLANAPPRLQAVFIAKLIILRGSNYLGFAVKGSVSEFTDLFEEIVDSGVPEEDILQFVGEITNILQGGE